MAKKLVILIDKEVARLLKSQVQYGEGRTEEITLRLTARQKIQLFNTAKQYSVKMSHMTRFVMEKFLSLNEEEKKKFLES